MTILVVTNGFDFTILCTYVVFIVSVYHFRVMVASLPCTNMTMTTSPSPTSLTNKEGKRTLVASSELLICYHSLCVTFNIPVMETEPWTSSSVLTSKPPLQLKPPCQPLTRMGSRELEMMYCVALLVGLFHQSNLRLQRRWEYCYDWCRWQACHLESLRTSVSNLISFMYR